GLNFQFFDLLKFGDITPYLTQTDAIYMGNRTFQLKTTVGVKTIAGLFGKEREADLYFFADCEDLVGSRSISELAVKFSFQFVDSNNPAAFRESERLVDAIGIAGLSDIIESYIGRQSDPKVNLTIEGPAHLFEALAFDAYRNGKPPVEPHKRDTDNYKEFVNAVRKLVVNDAIVEVFLKRFGNYSDWLAFNRVKTDTQGSTNPGDRKNLGNQNSEVWPDGFPPEDVGSRGLVQTYIYAAQAFMNMCESLQSLSSSSN